MSEILDNHEEQEEIYSRLDALRARKKHMTNPRENQMPEMWTGGPLHIPPFEIPEDKFYYWVLQHAGGEFTDDRILEMFRIGFNFVPPERHPRFKLPEKLNRENRGYITVGGLVLMEIDKNQYFKQYEHVRKKIDDSEKGLESLMGAGQSPFHRRLKNRYRRRSGMGENEIEWG